MYNAIQTVINATAKNDNTAVILKTIFLNLNHNLKLGDESSKTEITKHNTTEPSKYEDNATEFNNITEVMRVNLVSMRLLKILLPLELILLRGLLNLVRVRLPNLVRVRIVNLVRMN